MATLGLFITGPPWAEEQLRSRQLSTWADPRHQGRGRDGGGQAASRPLRLSTRVLGSSRPLWLEPVLGRPRWTGLETEEKPLRKWAPQNLLGQVGWLSSVSGLVSSPRGTQASAFLQRNSSSRRQMLSAISTSTSHLPSPSCKSSLKTKQHTFGGKAMPSSRGLALVCNLQAPDAGRRLRALPRPRCHAARAPTSLWDSWKGLARPLALFVSLLRNNVRADRTLT